MTTLKGVIAATVRGAGKVPASGLETGSLHQEVAANATSALRTLLILYLGAARVGQVLKRELDWQPIATTWHDARMAAVTR